MVSDDPTDMVDRIFGDRYRVLGFVGAGAVAEVFVAEDLEGSGRVALKVFDQSVGEDPELAERVIEAIGRTAAVDHPNVARVLQHGVDGVRIWVASELCTGGSLRTMLSFGHRLTPSQALVMSLELARGLAHAHAEGLVHCNVRPENVLFSADQRLRISDFGVAEALVDVPPARPSEAVEQVRYRSPEQAGGRPVGTASDLYSLALVANEAVSGAAPMAADTVVATLAARSESVIELTADLAGLRGPLERCGRLDPEDRPEADELTIALLAAAETMSRPGALPLVGIPGLDEPDSPPESELEPEEPIEVTVPGLDAPVELAVVPDLAERVALEDLDTAEPTFADTEADEPMLDIPAAAAPTGTRSVFRSELDDGDDQLPVWPLLVLGVLVAGAITLVMMLSNLSGGGSLPTPNVVGLDEAEVIAITDEQGWVLERLETRLDGSEAGTVVAQRPEAGSDLAEGETLTVTISLGSEMVEIPSDLGGLSLEQAQNRLEATGLVVGTVTEENSESLDAGLVIGIDEPTRQKPAGEAVALRVSVGPEDRVVPDTLIGVTVAEATAQLVGLRLQGVEEPVFDSVAEPGTVLGSVPPPGQVVAADSQVTLLVSAGPEPVRMPQLAELSLAQAVDELEARGLIFADTQGTPGEPVIGTIPAAGEIVEVGTEVTIVLDDPPEEQEEPADETDANEDSDG